LGFDTGVTVPGQTRWMPFEFIGEEGETEPNDFVEGLRLLAFSKQTGLSSVAIYVYNFNKSMDKKCFVNTDGDFLIVPQKGSMFVTTEFGRLDVVPNEILVIQQGMKFSIDCYDNNDEDEDHFNRGYVLEVIGNHFELPYLGPIGANGLANPRDFSVPTAWVDESDSLIHVTVWKLQNELFQTKQKYTHYDVAAWFGNYVPYKYNLENFVSVNSVSVDHPDPSIFTVLTCPSHGRPGTALADFVIFPPRWECARGTFRPPYFHRNCMTEFMGLIKGQYQAKGEEFAPGGASLHQAMVPHGPDNKSYRKGVSANTDEVSRVADGTMAFMFETSLQLKLTKWATKQKVDEDYQLCWRGLSDLDLRDIGT